MPVANIANDIASSQVIMMEVLIYCVPSLLILFLMDFYAAKRIGDKKRMGYKILRIPKIISMFIIVGFTFVVGLICMYNSDFSVTRSTLTYFGLPYFIALFYYMIKMMRRVRAETKGRNF